MHNARIGIFGASGYSGMELTRLCAAHGQLEVVFLASERHVGTSVERFTGVTGPVGRLAYVNFETARAQARGCDLVLLATPAEVSAKLAPELLAAGIKVVDLSGAFRLADEAEQARHYPTSPSGQTAAVYGMPELFRDSITGASFVANPGCYPTAATLAIYPLLAGGWIQAEDLVVSALSGATGAGRKASEDYSLVELHDDVKAYKVLTHQHTPEISQNLAEAAGGPVDLTFTPHLLPVPRGILCSVYARLARPVDSASLTLALRDFYKAEPFVRVAEKPEEVSLHAVVGTNQCLIGAACQPEEDGRVVIVSAIDNLVKGAAGQALQNVNLMLGFEETAGLASLRRFHP